jgi:hypothetical protein
MSAPSTAISRFDLSITYQEFNLLANLKKFIGLRVLPPIAVSQEAANFLRVKISSLLTKVEDTRRAPRGEYNNDTFEWDQDSYAVEDHGVTESVDDATVERYGDIIRVEQIAVLRGVNRMLSRLEYDAAAAVFNTTTWTGSALTLAAGVVGGGSALPWTTEATADPVADIDGGHDKINTNCGEDANTLVLTKKGYRAAIRTARVESLLKYNASEVLMAMNNDQNENLISAVNSGLCELFNVDQILVGRGFKNTADKGQTPTLSRMWDDTMAMLCCVHDDGLDGDLESPTPQVGRSIFSIKNDEPLPGQDDAGFGSLIFEEYREESIRGGKIRPRNKRGVKILHPQAGFLITGVTA